MMKRAEETLIQQLKQEKLDKSNRSSITSSTSSSPLVQQYPIPLESLSLRLVTKLWEDFWNRLFEKYSFAIQANPDRLPGSVASWQSRKTTLPSVLGNMQSIRRSSSLRRSPDTILETRSSLLPGVASYFPPSLPRESFNGSFHDRFRVRALRETEMADVVIL